MDCDFEPLSLSEEEMRVMLHLRNLSDTTGHEYGECYTNNSFSSPYTSNDENSVSVPGEYQEVDCLRLYHSHTNATLFSRVDYSLLLYRNVERITVVTSTGEIFSAYIGTGDVPTWDEYWEAVKCLNEDVVNSMLDVPGFFEWDFRRREIETYRELAFRIARHFKWTLEKGGTP